MNGKSFCHSDVQLNRQGETSRINRTSITREIH